MEKEIIYICSHCSHEIDNEGYREADNKGNPIVLSKRKQHFEHKHGTIVSHGTCWCCVKGLYGEAMYNQLRANSIRRIKHGKQMP